MSPDFTPDLDALNDLFAAEQQKQHEAFEAWNAQVQALHALGIDVGPIITAHTSLRAADSRVNGLLVEMGRLSTTYAVRLARMQFRHTITVPGLN